MPSQSTGEYQLYQLYQPTQNQYCHESSRLSTDVVWRCRAWSACIDLCDGRVRLPRADAPRCCTHHGVPHAAACDCGAMRCCTTVRHKLICVSHAVVRRCAIRSCITVCHQLTCMAHNLVAVMRSVLFNVIHERHRQQTKHPLVISSPNRRTGVIRSA